MKHKKGQITQIITLQSKKYKTQKSVRALISNPSRKAFFIQLQVMTHMECKWIWMIGINTVYLENSQTDHNSRNGIFTMITAFPFRYSAWTTNIVSCITCISSKIHWVKLNLSLDRNESIHPLPLQLNDKKMDSNPLSPILPPTYKPVTVLEITTDKKHL